MASDFLGDLGGAGEVVVARVGGRPNDDHFGPVLAGDGQHRVVVDALSFAVDTVGDELEPASGDVDRQTVGEVAAVIELEPHRGVSGFEQRVVGGQVGLRAGV